MHDGIQYDPIQGQGQGHEPFRVGNPFVSLEHPQSAHSALCVSHS